MLRSAIAHEDPVLIIENRSLYPDKGTVILDRPVDPLGHARIVRSGDDLTIVSWSRMVREAETAAGMLSAEGISAEVIDLRWLSPLDFETVRESLGRTGRLIIAHEANRTGGFGAEIAARVAEEAFDYSGLTDCARGHARRPDSGGSCAASRPYPGGRASG